MAVFHKYSVYNFQSSINRKVVRHGQGLPAKFSRINHIIEN